MGFRVSKDVEIEGMDTGIHGEQGWLLDQGSAQSIELPGNTPVEDSPARQHEVVTH